MAVVGSPEYLARRGTPATPQDLTHHDCVNFRMASGDVYVWEFGQDGRELRVRVEGRTVVNDAALLIDAAERGLGLICLPDDYLMAAIATGRLVRVLDDWCPPFAGYHLYYPSRRQHTAAFAAVVDALRWRG